MKAKDIMTERPQVVTPDDRVEKAAEIMREHDVGFVPIVNNRDTMTMEGVITDRDITVRHVAEAHSRECTLRQHMTRTPIETVRSDDDLRDVEQVMQRAQVRRVPVVEGSRLIGVIAQADIAVAEAREHPDEVATTVEKISEPAHGKR
jgi:CBS domain-containing protein